MRKLSFSLAALGLMLAMGSSAFGDEIFNLTVPENTCTTTTPPCAPSGTVQVDVDLLTNGAGTSTATVTFTGETVGGNAYSMYNVLFEVNGSFGISSYVVTGGSAAGTVTSPANNSGMLDSYGTFSEESETLHNATKVVFNLDDGTWTSSANVLATTPLPNGNSGGYAQPFDAAAQVRVNDCTSSTEPGCSGDTGSDGSTMDSAGFEPGSGNGNSSVPEPSSWLLMASVVFGLAVFTRKRFSATFNS
jgi:hypothetical protein